jgi:hypothetical protein
MNYHQDDWVDWLPLAEFAANNTISEITVIFPFFTNHGFNSWLGVKLSTPYLLNLTDVQKAQFYKINTTANWFDQIITQLKALA